MDIPHHARVMGHLPIVFYPGRPTRTLIAMAISAMVELFFSSSILLNSLIGMDLIPTHVGGGCFLENNRASHPANGTYLLEKYEKCYFVSHIGVHHTDVLQTLSA